MSAPLIQTGSSTGLDAFLFGRTIPGGSRSRINLQLGSGDNDIFTVPPGSRALCIWQAYNTAATTTTFFQKAKIGGAYYRMTSNGTIATNVSTSTGVNALILEAGESFAINTTQAGMNVFGTAFVFPNTASPKSPRLLTQSNGDNTLYTCPAGYTATVVLGNAQMLQSSNGNEFFVVNESGGSLNYTFNIVKSGGSVGATNKAYPVTAVANNAQVGFPFNEFTLSAGDFINVNVSGAVSQGLVWFAVQELPV